MWTEEKLEEILTKPSDRLVKDIQEINDDIMVLGAGGKMGPSLCVLAKKAIDKAKNGKKVYAVSRFSDAKVRENLEKQGVIVLPTDLTKKEEIAKLPKIKNIIMMVGKKFGTSGNECETWGMNVAVPTLICEHFTNSSFVVFSTGNIYPLVPASSGGSLESDKVNPIGEYTQSCLGRERVFEYYCRQNKIKLLIFRLSYSIALKYGVLSDIAEKVANDDVLCIDNGCFNCIWQGDAIEFAIRSLLQASNPPKILNITGPEIAGVKSVAKNIGQELGKEPKFSGESSNNAYLENAQESISIFGYPQVPLGTMIKWQAQWLKDGGDNIHKPTHFEERKGSY